MVYNSKARVSEEKLVEMETAIQALQAFQSYCFLDIPRGFAEFCKQTLGFQVDDGLMAMLISGRSMSSERKSQLLAQIGT